MRADSFNTLPMRSDATTRFFVRAALVWLVLAIVCSAAFLYSDAILWSVVAPLVACGLVTLGFLMYLRRIEPAMPYLEIGVFYAAVTFLYCAYPLVLYIVNGYSYPGEADSRLAALQNRPRDLGTLAWWYVAYLSCFCLAYAVARGRGVLRSPLTIVPRYIPTISAIVILLVSTQLFFAVLGWFFDMSTASYFEQYLVIQRLPHVIRQITAHLRVIGLTLQMMLVITLCSTRRRRYHAALIAILLLITLSHVIRPGARVQLFSVILATVAAYHLTVRRIPFHWMAIGALTAFLGLLLMGPAREEGKHSIGQLVNRMAMQTEFTVVMGNAVDLKYLQNSSGGFLGKPSLYWSGILAMVPQQLIPIEKDTAAAWYARENYREYFEKGGGLAFGVLSEAVMGHGFVELIWRGALVGALLGLLHRRLMRGQVSLEFVMFYIWMIVWSYQTIRNGTFSLLMIILYHFIVPLLGVLILGGVLRGGRLATRRLISPSGPSVV